MSSYSQQESQYNDFDDMGDDPCLNLSARFEEVADEFTTPATSKTRGREGAGDGPSRLPAMGSGQLWQRLERLDAPQASDTPPARPNQAEAAFETEAKVAAPNGGRKRTQPDRAILHDPSDAAVKRRPAAAVQAGAPHARGGAAAAPTSAKTKVSAGAHNLKVMRRPAAASTLDDND